MLNTVNTFRILVRQPEKNTYRLTGRYWLDLILCDANHHLGGRYCCDAQPNELSSKEVYQYY